MALGVLLVAPAARAQASGEDIATAQALFEEGKRLMHAGQYAEACPKLVESQRLDPGGGTALAIAICHEGEGKTATAWADFNVALGEARKDRRSDRESAALDHISALEPKLTRVRISVVATAPGLQITRDGTLVGEAQWGTPLPLDPGEHHFEARAPGKVAWTQDVAIQGEGATVDVQVPPLADDPEARTAPPTVPTIAPPDDRAGAPLPTRGRIDRSYLVATVALGAVGLAAGAVGVGFGLSARSDWQAARDACPGGKCTDAGDVSRGADAARSADLATVFLSIGAVGVASAAVLYLIAPRESRPRTVRLVPSAGRTSAGLALEGAL